jgi:hypothetical protein
MLGPPPHRILLLILRLPTLRLLLLALLLHRLFALPLRLCVLLGMLPLGLL